MSQYLNLFRKFCASASMPHVVTLVFLLAAVAVSFRSGLVGLATVWFETDDYSHGWLIAPIAAWLIWRNRRRVVDVNWSGIWLGLLIIFVAGFVWLASDLARINAAKWAAIVAIAVASFVITLGRDFARVNTFPLMFLFMMVPIGQSWIPILMEYTASATVWALHVVGIPVFRENLVFVLPTGRWSVVEACSGLRYVLAALVLSLLFAYLNFNTWFRRMVFVGVCIMISLVANWIRAFLIVLIGHFSKMKLGVGDDHVWYGWVFFGITMAAIFWLGSRFDSGRAKTSHLVVPDSAPLSPESTPVKLKVQSYSGMTWCILIGLLVLAFSHFAPPHFRNFQPHPDQFLAQEIQRDGSPVTAFPFQPGYTSALAVRETKTSQGVYIWRAYYARFDVNADVIGFQQKLVPSDRHDIVVLDSRAIEVPSSSGADSVSVKGKMKELRIRIADGEYLIWTFYRIGGHITSSPYIAKLITLWDVLGLKGDHSMVYAMAMRVDTKESALRDAMAAQLIRLFP